MIVVSPRDIDPFVAERQMIEKLILHSHRLAATHVLDFVDQVPTMRRFAFDVDGATERRRLTPN